MLQAVFFDLDGTLVYGFDRRRGVAVDLHEASWHAVLSTHGVTLDGSEYVTSMSGHTNAECEAFVRERWPEVGDAALADAKEAHYRSVEVPARLALVPGAAALLDALGQRAVATGMLTNAPAENIEAARAALGLDRWFEPSRIVTGDELVAAGLRAKPAPDGLHVLFDRLEVRPEGCVFVGDSPADIEAARGAGVVAAGIETTHEASILRDLGARVTAPDFHRLDVGRLAALI